MTQNTQTASISQSPSPDIDRIDRRLRGLLLTTELPKRSALEAMQRTGLSFEELQECNKQSYSYAEHRIRTAIAISLKLGWSLAKRAIARVARVSRTTVDVHAELLEERLDDIKVAISRCKPRDWRNKIRWLGRRHNRLVWVATTLQELADRFNASRNRRSKVGNGRATSNTLDRRTNPPCVQQSSTKNRFEDFRVPKGSARLTSLQVAQAVYSVLIQGTDSGAGGDVRAGSATKEENNFSLRFSKPNAADDPRSTVERSGTARDKSGDALRSPNVRAIDLETGEVICMSDDRSVVWSPSVSSPKPPGNPFLKKRSENETQVPAAKIEPQFAPSPPPRVLPPKRDNITPLDESEIYVPCPEEIKQQIGALCDKFNMDNLIRANNRKRLERTNPNMSHLERLDLEEGANENWFRKNGTLVRSVLLNFGAP